MKWYEYKMEVDDLHASEQLKARLLAMQPAVPTPAPAPAAPARKKPVRFALRRFGALAACAAVCVLCYGTFRLGSGGGISTASVSDGATKSRMAVDDTESYALADVAMPELYSLDTDNSLSRGSVSTVQSDVQTAARSTDSTAIIYTATLTLESKDYDTAHSLLETAVADADGYMESSDEQSGTDAARSAYFTIRVPQQNYQTFLDDAAAAANLVSKSQQAEDVTTQYMDVQARLDNLTSQRSRLQELQQQAQSLADLLDIESSLSDVQYQIESWQSQLDWYSDQTAKCTVYVTLNEVQDYTAGTASFGERIASAFRSGWGGFVAAAQQVLVGLVCAWPLLALLAVLGMVFALLHKRRKTRRSDR